MKVTEGGSIANHLNEFDIVTSQLSSVNVNIDEEISQCYLDLCSLSEGFMEAIGRKNQETGNYDR